MASDKSSKIHTSDKEENVVNEIRENREDRENRENHENRDNTDKGNETLETMQTNNPATDENQGSKKKITITVDEDDPCLKDDDKKPPARRVPGLDPRFQQQNQSVRCWVMYTDFYRCEHILGAGSDACTWFKEVYNSLCPNEWLYQWDKLREEGKLSWHKERTQGNFPGDKYGV